MATAPISTTGPLFQAGGLASGLDTTSIVNSIITSDSAAMTQAQAEQAAYKVQISTVATLTSKLQALQSAADALGTSGLAPIQATSTYADFTVSGSAQSEGDQHGSGRKDGARRQATQRDWLLVGADRCRPDRQPPVQH